MEAETQNLWEWKDGLFVGRSEEIALLRESLSQESASSNGISTTEQARRNRCFFVDGPSGIGKSALLAEAFSSYRRSTRYGSDVGSHPPTTNGDSKMVVTAAGFEDSQATTPLMVWVEAAEGILSQLQDDKRFAVHLYRSFQRSGQQHADYLSILSSVLGHRLSESFSIRATSHRISLTNCGIVSEEATSLLLSEDGSDTLDNDFMSAFDSNEKDYSFEALRLAYRQLFRIICEYTTVILCLDDLQWGEVDDFHILKTLLLDTKMNGRLIFVGAHRPVSFLHPLRFVKRALTYQTIQLEPLNFEDIQTILNKVFPGDDPPEDLEELAGALQDRTSGNPFYLRVLLRSLEQEGGLRCKSRAENTWEWDAAKIREDTKSDIEIVAQLLRNATPLTSGEGKSSLAHVMGLAAFLGKRRISFQVMVWLLEEEADGSESETQLLSILNQAIESGIMERIRSGFSRKQVTNSASRYYQFKHDKFRHGALLCLPNDEESQKRLHLKIGLRLRALHDVDPAKDRFLFLVVTQLNEGSIEIKSPRELNKLAKLNYQAAAASLKRSAFYSAVHFLRCCLEHLGPLRLDGEAADFALQAEMALARMEYCCGLLDKSLERSSMLLQHQQSHRQDSGSFRREAALHHLQMLCLIQQSHPDKALAVALDALHSLGVKYPKTLVKVQVMRKVGKARRALQKKTDDDLLGLRWARDIRYNLAAGFLPRIIALCRTHGYDDHISCSTLVGLELTLDKGRNPMTSQALCYWGLVLATEGHLDEAVRLGRLALHMSHERRGGLLDDRIPTLYYSWIHHWKDPYANALQPVSSALKSMWEVGLLEAVVEDTPTFLRLFYLSGFRLETLLKEVRQYATLCNDFGMEFYRRKADPFAQMIVNFVEGPYELMLRGEFMEESVTLRYFKERKSTIGIQLFCFHKMMLSYIFNEYESAAKFSKNIEDMFIEGADVWVPYRFYFRGMVAWTMFGKTNKKRHRVLAQLMTGKIQEWANSGVVNCEHYLLVLKAEKASSHCRDGSKRDAVQAAFDEAIASCKAKGCRNDAAIANERAGYYFLKIRNPIVASDYLIEARDAYIDWQAHAKARQLQKRFQELIGPYEIRKSIRESPRKVAPAPSLRRQLSMDSINEKVGELAL